MSAMAKRRRTHKKWYAVVIGRQPGVYTTWEGVDGARTQVFGFKGSCFKGFNVEVDAQNYLAAHNPSTCPTCSARTAYMYNLGPTNPVRKSESLPNIAASILTDKQRELTATNQVLKCEPIANVAGYTSSGLLETVPVVPVHESQPIPSVTESVTVAQVEPAVHATPNDVGSASVSQFERARANRAIALCVRAQLTQKLPSKINVDDGLWSASEAFEVKHVLDGESPALDSADQDDVDTQASIVFPPEQQEVLNQVEAGANVLITGGGGVGKTTVLNEVIRRLITKHGRHSVMITAPTGIAATHINGTTIHSALGIGIPRLHRDFGRMWSKTMRPRIRELKVLVVDEISMLSGEMLDWIETVINSIRTGEDKRKSAGFLPRYETHPTPMGGVQLVLCGDFFQLSPIERSEKMVKRKNYKHLSKGNYLKEIIPKEDSVENWFWNRGFAFQSHTFVHGRLVCIPLTRVFRQEDAEMVRMLSNIRSGQGVEEAAKYFNDRCCRPLAVLKTDCGREIEPIVLQPTNSSAENINRCRLEALKAPVFSYRGYDYVVADGIYAKFLAQKPESKNSYEEYVKQFEMELLWHDSWTNGQFQVPGPHTIDRRVNCESLNFKIGAQVILVKNLDLHGEKKLVNGSLGVIVDVVNADAVEHWLSRLILALDEADKSGGTIEGIQIPSSGSASRQPPTPLSGTTRSQQFAGEPHAEQKMELTPRELLADVLSSEQGSIHQTDSIHEVSTEVYGSVELGAPTRVLESDQGSAVASGNCIDLTLSSNPDLPSDDEGCGDDGMSFPSSILSKNSTVIADIGYSDVQPASSMTNSVATQNHYYQAPRFSSSLSNVQKSARASLRGKLLEEYSALKQFLSVEGNDHVLPIVQFDNGRKVRIMPELFDCVTQVGSCNRLQIPLKLAWSITIHKSQGMTLERVRMNLDNCFATGQVYVALSRAKSLDGLEIIGSGNWAHKVTTSSDAIRFYESIGNRPIELTEGNVQSLWSTVDAASLITLEEDIY